MAISYQSPVTALRVLDGQQTHYQPASAGFVTGSFAIKQDVTSRPSRSPPAEAKHKILREFPPCSSITLHWDREGYQRVV